MRRKPGNLSNRISDELERAEILVYYFEAETSGNLIEFGMKFRSGQSLVLYCRENGDVGVVEDILEESHPTPYWNFLVKEIEGISGRLVKSQSFGSKIYIEFENGNLLAVNYDDQLDVEINNKPLDSKFLNRE
jgi:hypothetical protein